MRVCRPEADLRRTAVRRHHPAQPVTRPRGSARAHRGRRLAPLPRDGRRTEPRSAARRPATRRVAAVGPARRLLHGRARRRRRGPVLDGDSPGCGRRARRSSVAPSRTPRTSPPSTCTCSSPRHPRITPRRSPPAPGSYTEPVRQRLEMGRYVLAEDYVRALTGAAVLRREVDAALEDCDALVLPSVPITGAAHRQHDADACRPLPPRPRADAPPDSAVRHHRPPGRSRCRAATRRRTCRPACSSSAAAAAQPNCWRSPQRSRRSWARYNSSSMIAPLFYAWERRLHSRSPDRVVRPFEWGLDWVAPNGHGPGTPEDEILADWARTALADSPAFFAAPPTRDFQWEPERSGDATCAGTIVFPSVITTPHPENNVVYGRLFPAARKKGGGEDRRRAVVVLPQWNSDAGGHVGLSRLLARFGDQRAAPQPAVSRPAHAAHHDARGLHRVVERRPDGAGLPAGRSRCAPRRGVARAGGVRADRDRRHEPGVVPGDTDVGARAADSHPGAEPHLALLRRRGLGRAVHRTRAGRPRRPHHAGAAARALDADQPAGVRVTRAGQEDAARLRALRHHVPRAPLARPGSRVPAPRGALPAVGPAVRPLHDRPAPRSSTSMATC